MLFVLVTAFSAFVLMVCTAVIYANVYACYLFSEDNMHPGLCRAHLIDAHRYLMIGYPMVGIMLAISFSILR